MKRAVLLGVVLAIVTAQPVRAQHEHHQHGAEMPVAPALQPDTAAPALPADHAADAFFDPAEMAAAREQLRYESGGMPAAMILIDRFELTSRNSSQGYRWEGEGWIGGDLDRLVLKSEGEGGFGDALEQAEVQALYSRALDPWFNLQLGLRHDLRPRPRRSHAVLGIEGLAPYWFEIDGALFLSDRGELTARIEASHDIRLTQRLLLTPSAELNLSAQRVPELGLGTGLTSAELGLRLHYAVEPRFAPYVGLHWEGLAGAAARFARQRGQDARQASLVAGMRFWF